MNNLTTLCSPTESDHDEQLTRGRVLSVGDDGLFIETARGRHHYQRATSCLVEPRAGDLVLLTGASDSNRDDDFVLAVLERDADTTTKLVVEGRLRIEASEGVEVVSPADIRLVSANLALSAIEGEIAIERLSVIGKLVQGHIDKVKLVASTIDHIADRVLQRVKRSYRTIEQFEQLRARHIDYRAEETMSLRGKHTVLTARRLVKIDSEQIHVG